jgi:bile acid-coenzyme A ligase
MTAPVPVRARITQIARADPARPALIGYGTGLAEQVLSWHDLAAQVTGTAAALTAVLDPGTRPCAVVPAANTLAAAIAIAAALAAEIPVFPMNPATPPAERDALLHQLARRFTSACLIGEDLTPQRIELPAPAGSPGQPGAASAGAGKSGAAAQGTAGGGHPAVPGGVAYLLATGASSGIPKISARPGPLRYDRARTPSAVIRAAGWQAGQRHLIVGPLYHAAPFTSFLDALLDANTTILQPVFSPQWTADLIRAHAIQWLQLTPAHMREILALPALDPAGFTSIRAMLHTAARCDPATKHGWITLLGPGKVYELYGATESIGVTLVRGDEWLTRPGTVGRGFLTQIRIQDPAGNPVPPGTPGTVYMRTPGPAGRSDYVSDQAIPVTLDGYATVGDHGRLDSDGYLYLDPRDHDIINVGGEKVDPDEVEAALRAHPAVKDAVAVAVPHQTLGSVVGAHILLHPGTTVRKAELAAHCGQRLAGFKIPKQFQFVDHLPRSAAGKAQRWRLAPTHQNGTTPP